MPYLDPFEPRHLPVIGTHFWSLNTLLPSGVMRQSMHPLSAMENVLRNVGPANDTYMSQALFDQPLRRVVHMSAGTHALVDLDTYRAPELLWLTADQRAGLIRKFCRNEGIQPPSAIISSGRGLYLKWYWASPISRADGGRAMAVNRALVERFARFGADPAAIDMARILRVIGTVNQKSRSTVEFVWLEQSHRKTLTYDFGMFSSEVLSSSDNDDDAQSGKNLSTILKFPRVAIRNPQPRTVGQYRRFSRMEWHWGVLEDLRTLAILRGGGRIGYANEQPWDGRGPIPPGADIFGHIGACQLAKLVPPHSLWPEIQATVGILLPVDYATSPEFQRHAATLMDRAQRAYAGDGITFDGHMVGPVYTYSKDRLIDILQVSPAEMPAMTRLIDGDEKRRRDTEATRAARRLAGAQERSAYEADAKRRQISARSLRANGHSWGDVAKKLGVKSADAARMLASRHG